ncbi:MAG: DUF4393 domain-containing protein [Pseudomonadota bacterium]
MTDEEEAKPASTAAIAGELIRAAKDSPTMREAGNEFGQSFLTVGRAINNALLPIAAMNYGFEKAKEYFASRFIKDMEDKASRIPPERLIEPSASVAGPALQGLAFAHEEESLRDMYLSLIASAMDKEVSGSAHPAFVEIIKQLGAKDADLLQSFLGSTADVEPIAEVRRSSIKGDGYVPVRKHLLDLVSRETRETTVVPELPAIVDNWIRLGLVTVDYNEALMEKSAYDWCDNRPEYLEIKARLELELESNEQIEVQKGVLRRTAFGKQFAGAVGILQVVTLSDQQGQ